ncbi:MAG: DUF192 domain-containing protein [Solirubrobacterales bacterium]|nr:DUF192 domain-containing protein [Solirubrobacterales bacterium]
MEAPEGSAELVLAERPSTRLLGLMGVAAEAAPPLLFPSCRSVHTFWMRFAIDLAFIALPAGLTGEARVLELRLAVAPRRCVSLGRAARGPTQLARVGLIELSAGKAAELGIEIEARLELTPRARAGGRPPGSPDRLRPYAPRLRHASPNVESTP